MRLCRWATLTGRVRPQRLFRRKCSTGESSSSSSSRTGSDSAAQHTSRNLVESAHRFLDNSLYALCFRSRLQLGSRTTLSTTSELDSLSCQAFADQQSTGEQTRPPWRGRVSLRHKLDQQKIVAEAAYHERYVDRESRYWDVPHTVSFDFASLGAPGGFRYRLGVHHSAGSPLECGGTRPEVNAGEPPVKALPGLRLQAAASVEKSLNLWKADLESIISQKSYSLFDARPCISLSGVLGGLLSSRLDPLYGITQSLDPTGADNSPPIGRRHSADLFASVGLNAQFGRFKRNFWDFTKMGIRLDIGAVSALKLHKMQDVSPSSNGESGDIGDERGHPTLALELQQQVIGPLRARVHSRVSFNPLNLNQQPYVQEIICGLDYPLEASGASKLCVWYSPSRREGMAEFRVLER